MEVLHAQPPLTKAFLFDLIADETLPASVRASVLIEQPAVSDDLFQEVLKMKSGWTPEAVEDLLVNGTAYPADPLIIGLLKQDPPLPSEVLRNILAANPNDWSEALRIEVAGSYALRFPDRDHLLRNGATGLLQFCGSPCASSNMGISTIIDYSYYEANPDGRTNTPGYRALLGLEDEQAVPMIQLKWEPSWLLFSTRTSSPQYPDAFQEQRAFYYQDLRNRYDRHWTMLADEENFQVDDDENGNYPIEDNFGISIPQVFGPHSDPDEATGHYIVPKMEVMEVLREFDDRTDRPFETHVISKAAAKDHPVIRATYHQYSARWKWDDLPTYELVVSGVPCFPDTPPGIQVDLNSDMPLASTITPYTKLNSSNWQDHERGA
ncbi:MAG: hypothetical protein IPH60_08640 [Flavobacteriales bacterium]|nr:hypothetical protein [Flavobacteriales bacterium]